ncbi:hypothetical protein CK203_004512 [Vitis vinifera]|uniref:Reverse transcriptase Ty1/copia-type domain-containing protein n=1 Tax=Vitis vinifera TaxID=29760 RepID=A0A438KG28_VITVI|nr:hypothetical protein CK203_004512 [Vitis vinifera]
MIYPLLFGKVEEHFPRHVQGLGLRKNSRRTPEKLFEGPTEAKEPQKRHVQGSDGRNRYEGWLVGVRRSWRRKRVVEKWLTRWRMRCSRRPEKRAWPARGWFSGSGALGKIGDLLQALLVVWEKYVAGKVRQKSDRNETRSQEGFPELMTRGNWKELGIKEVKDYFKNTSRTKDLRLLHYFLGLEVPHGRGEIVLSKRKYVLELLNEIDMLGEKPVDTPMEQNVNLNGDDSLYNESVHGSTLEDSLGSSVQNPEVSQRYYRHCGILNPCGELASSMDFDIASLKGLTITVMICEADLDIVRYSIL